jgi:hypothetical protein
MVMAITFVKGKKLRGNRGARSCRTPQFPPTLPNDPPPDNIAADLEAIEVSADGGVSFALLQRLNHAPSPAPGLDADWLL